MNPPLGVIANIFTQKLFECKVASIQDKFVASTFILSNCRQFSLSWILLQTPKNFAAEIKRASLLPSLLASAKKSS
jgi:hypothetical protein